MAKPAEGESERVELYNPQKIDLSTHYLDDDTDFLSDSGSSKIKIISSLLTDTQTDFPYQQFSVSQDNW